MSTTHQLHGPDQQESNNNSSFVVELPEKLAAAGWKHRWRLAPVYLAAGAGMFASAGYGLAAAGGLGLGAVLAAVCARKKWTFQGRTLMSQRERRLAAIGLAATAAWSACTAAASFMPPVATASLLPAVLAIPSYHWVASRRTPTPPPVQPLPFSPLAAAVVNGWTDYISIGHGPRELQASMPVLDSLTEPAPGAMVMEIELGFGVNAKSVATQSNADKVEAILSRAVREVLPEGMPSGTVKLETVRNASTRMRVVVTPSRHLEQEGGMPYQGAILLDDGRIPLADCPTGGVAHVHLFDASGVKHGLITGTSGAGKSCSTAVVIMPGVKAGLELVFYLDGKRGASAGTVLDNAITRLAVNPEQWTAMIDMVHRILIDREIRRGQQRKTGWKALEEVDPIITLLIDEATTVNNAINSKRVEYVSAILQKGRAFGVRLIEISQSPAAEHIIGGAAARDLLTSAGFAICHRAGGSGSTRLALDSAPAVNVDLRGLPDGHAAVLSQGQLMEFPSAVRYASDDVIKAELEGIVPLELVGADLAAAGAIYAPHNWGYNTSPTPSSEPAYGTPEQSQPAQEDLPASRFWVLDRLRAHPAGLTLMQLEAAGAADPEAPSRRTISTALGDLAGRGAVAKNGSVWTAVPSELTDDPDEESQ